jgi:hypothetical protein
MLLTHPTQGMPAIPDLFVDSKELVGERGSSQISLVNVSENFAFCLLGLRNVAKAPRTASSRRTPEQVGDR